MREPSEQRERELSRPKGQLAARFSCRPVGCSAQPDYPTNLKWLAQLEDLRDGDSCPYPNFGGDMAQHYAEKDWEQREAARGIPIYLDLEREPDNPHDPNAVAVLHDGDRIGYITRPLANRLARELDAGVEWQVTLEHVYIDPDHTEHPGLSVLLERQEAT